MKELIKNVLDKIEFSIIVKTVYFATIVFTIIPSSWLEKISLLDFKNKYQFIFSICFIILTCYYVSFLIEYVKKKIKSKILLKKKIKLIKKLSVEEQQYIMTFYNYDSRRFDTEAEFDISNAVVNLLESKMIIGRGSSLSVGYTTFSYFLQPWAQEFLNEQVSLNNIKVNGNSFSWNLQ